jgi:biofilm PGA synthesis N-glycosyltransferase PgaC
VARRDRRYRAGVAEPQLSYAVVTPARNEAAALPRLAESLDEQTVAPAAWVVVDNGSDDDTLGVARNLAAERPWTSVVEEPGESVPTRGGPVARAFMAGIAALEAEPDVVVKVDADVSFDPDYFEQLLAAFAADDSLGIAGGTCWEQDDGAWVERYVTGDRVRGASRAYRRACLEQVLPLEQRAGWDGIDELKAAARGWSTRSIRSLRFYHHRTTSARDASRRRRLLETGRSNWYAGYRPSYLVLRALFKARREPVALVMIWGYVSAALRREPRCADVEARVYIRRQQSLRRLPLRAREAVGRRT